jgi:putative endonuclease
MNHKYYVGSTRDDTPLKRLLAHNKGKTRSTKAGRPWVLIYTEKQTTYTESRKRELFLKSGVGRKWLKTSLE